MSASIIQETAPATKPDESAPDSRTRLGRAWHRLRMVISEMNYASRRVVELQAPWAATENQRSR